MFNDFIEEGKVKATTVDKEKIKSLLLSSDNYLLSLSKIEFDGCNSSMLISSYYDALRMMVEALAIKYGYNIYSHEAFTSFIDEMLGKSILSMKFDRIRKIRNGISYYGNVMEADDAKEISREIIVLIKDFKRLI